MRTVPEMGADPGGRGVGGIRGRGLSQGPCPFVGPLPSIRGENSLSVHTDAPRFSTLHVVHFCTNAPYFST